MLKQYIKLEYIYIFLSIVWSAFGGKLQIDQAGRLVDLLMIVTLCSLFFDRTFLKTFRSPVSISMGVWVLYVLIQFTFMHSPSLNKDIYIHYCSILRVYIIMLIVQRDILNGNFQRIANVLAVSYLIYSLFAFLFIGISINIDNRTEISYLNDPNDISFAACMCGYLLMLKFFSKQLKLYIMLAASLIVVFLVMRLGSRTAFLEMVLIGIFAGAILLKKTKLKTVYYLAAVAVVLLIFSKLSLFMDNTMIGQRLAESDEQIEFQSGTILDHMGDRGPFYYFGFQEFLSSPVFGIGLKNFSANNVYYERACHSEYMVNLAETGAVGAALFFIFIVCLIFCISRISQDVLPFDRSLLVLSVLIPLFIALFFWTYDRSYVFVMYGLIGGYYLKEKQIYHKMIVCDSQDD